jgi:hypothetical protein
LSLVMGGVLILGGAALANLTPSSDAPSEPSEPGGTPAKPVVS